MKQNVVNSVGVSTTTTTTTDTLLKRPLGGGGGAPLPPPPPRGKDALRTWDYYLNLFMLINAFIIFCREPKFRNKFLS